MYQGTDFENFLWYLDHVHRRHSRRLRPPDRHCICPNISAPSGAEYQVVILKVFFAERVQPFRKISRSSTFCGPFPQTPRIWRRKRTSKRAGKKPRPIPSSHPPRDRRGHSHRQVCVRGDLPGLCGTFAVLFRRLPRTGWQSESQTSAKSDLPELPGLSRTLRAHSTSSLLVGCAQNPGKSRQFRQIGLC